MKLYALILATGRELPFVDGDGCIGARDLRAIHVTSTYHDRYLDYRSFVGEFGSKLVPFGQLVYASFLLL